jgi:hypothetical protein
MSIPHVSSAVFSSLKHNLIQMFVLDKCIYVWLTGAEGVLEIACLVMFGNAFLQSTQSDQSEHSWLKQNILVY